jgi:hypothetical protein
LGSASMGLTCTNVIDLSHALAPVGPSWLEIMAQIMALAELSLAASKCAKSARKTRPYGGEGMVARSVVRAFLGPHG